MKYDIHGRFRIEVRHQAGGWIVYRVDEGRRARLPDIVIPDGTGEDEIATFLDDVFHEYAVIGQRVEVLHG